MGFFDDIQTKFFKSLSEKIVGGEGFPVISVSTEDDAVALDVLYVGLVSADGEIDQDEQLEIASLAADAYLSTYSPNHYELPVEEANELMDDLIARISQRSEQLLAQGDESGDYNEVFLNAAARFKGTDLAYPVLVQLSYLACLYNEVAQDEAMYLEDIAVALGVDSRRQKEALESGRSFAQGGL